MRPALLAGAGFFLLLCSYYILRPVRDDMAVQFGAGRLHWLFSATFAFTLLIVPCFGWAVRRLPQQRVLPYVYGFLALNLFFFASAFATFPGKEIAAAFFVWLSVFNLFIVSLFWSRLGDTFGKEGAKRHYGYIAAGGTAGAIAGPAVTAALASAMETPWLVALAGILLSIAALLITSIGKNAGNQSANPETPIEETRPIGGSLFAGITVILKQRTLMLLAMLIVLYTSVSTVFYIELVGMAGKTFAGSGERTAFFAKLDLAVNLSALALQLLGTRRLAQKAGLRILLSIMPVLLFAGCAGLAVARGLPSLALLQVTHRAGEYAFSRPGREMVYAALDPESRYKAKSFIDTAVYRGSDALNAWLIAFVRGAGGDALALIAIPAAMLWCVTAWRLGGRHDE